MEAVVKNAETLAKDSPDSLFRNHGQAVYAYAVRRVGNSSTAEDISSEVFLEALRHSKRRIGGDPLPWLYGIARRKVADHLRMAGRRKAESLSDLLPASTKDPHDAFETIEETGELRRLVDSLPEDQREALLLYYVENLTADRVAASMNKSAAAVNSLLQRARNTIREKSTRREEELR
jgi:RNA polymerase sigma-70 factor (ECF subfamily)